MAKRQRRGEPGEKPTDRVDLRIIGGHFRGAKLTSEPLVQSTGAAAGQLVTRPMKHRVREAIFNLVGLDAKGKHAIDVFAGTGALGLEAISRGAESATLIERHVPTAGVVRSNVTSLGVEDRCEVLVTSAFLWAKRDLAADWPTRAGSPQAERPWLAFVSPPYEFFVERADEMLSLVAALKEHSPGGSVLVVESDARFDFGVFPEGVKPTRHDAGWDVRDYAPARVGVLRLPEG